MSRRALTAGAAVLLLALGGAVGAGCGSDDGDGGGAKTAGFVTGVTTPDYLRTSTGPYETTVEGTATFIKTDKDGNPIPKTSEGDAGDEEGIRVPAVYTVTADGLDPAPIVVPPRLPVELRATSGDDKAHEVVFATKPKVTLRVPASGSVTEKVGGQPAGTIDATVDGGAAVAALDVRDDAVGP